MILFDKINTALKLFLSIDKITLFLTLLCLSIKSTKIKKYIKNGSDSTRSLSQLLAGTQLWFREKKNRLGIQPVWLISVCNLLCADTVATVEALQLFALQYETCSLTDSLCIPWTDTCRVRVADMCVSLPFRFARDSLQRSRHSHEWQSQRGRAGARRLGDLLLWSRIWIAGREQNHLHPSGK